MLIYNKAEIGRVARKVVFFNGYGCPSCPNCSSGRGISASDYGDFKCNTCGNEFRKYGNGGLHLGMIPRCPECGGYCSEI